MIVNHTNPSHVRGRFLRCIDLLDEEHKTLDYTVQFYKNEERLKKEMIEAPDLSPEEYDQIFHGKVRPPAIAIQESRTIKIFYFNFTDEKYRKEIDLAFFLFHEIRHAWQNSKGLYLDEPAQGKIDDNMEDYKNSPAEKDANEFARDKINENKNELKKIFDIPTSVTFQYELKW